MLENTKYTFFHTKLGWYSKWTGSAAHYHFPREMNSKVQGGEKHKERENKMKGKINDI